MKHKKVQKKGKGEGIKKDDLPEKGLVEPKLLLKDEELVLKIKKLVDSAEFEGSFEQFAVKAMISEVITKAREIFGLEGKSDEEVLKITLDLSKMQAEEAAKEFDVDEGWKKLKAKIDEEEQKLN